MILDEERQYFESQRGDLLSRCRNQFVLIKGSKLIGVYPDAQTAYAEGLQRLGLAPFLVRQVLEDEPIAVAPALSVVPLHAGL